MHIPDKLKYSKEHEWVKAEGNTAMIGITAFATEQLGDIVFVELPEVGAIFGVGQDFGVVESVKTVSTLFCPVAGKVTEVNIALQDEPQKINASPYDEGWIIKVEMKDPNQLNNLLTSKKYAETLNAS